jgi:predicted membrane protein
MAGATIDLREAIPADGGSVVQVTTLLGGTAVLVRKDWDVEVVQDTKSSEVEVRLDSETELPPDSPKVTVHLRTTYGGALVGYETSDERDG